MRVLIAVPTFENITPDTFKALWDLEKPCECSFEFVRGYDCATARNKIAQKALDGGYDYTLMVDNDITPPHDALVNLLSHDVDVVSGFYLCRNKDNTPGQRTCVFRLNDRFGRAYFNYTKDSEFVVDELRELKESGTHLVKIHGCGMGCTLVKPSVFNRIEYPWFDWVSYKNREHLSEDLYFCEGLRKAGIPQYVDTRVSCGHLFRRIERAE